MSTSITQSNRHFNPVSYFNQSFQSAKINVRLNFSVSAMVVIVNPVCPFSDPSDIQMHLFYSWMMNKKNLCTFKYYFL